MTWWSWRHWPASRLTPRLLDLQVFAVEARYDEGPFPLPAAREVLLALVEAELDRCALRVKERGASSD